MLATDKSQEMKQRMMKLEFQRMEAELEEELAADKLKMREQRLWAQLGFLTLPQQKLEETWGMHEAASPEHDRKLISGKTIIANDHEGARELVWEVKKVVAHTKLTFSPS